MRHRRRRHTPEQIVRKLREADRLLGEGLEVPEDVPVSACPSFDWIDTVRGPRPRAASGCPQHRRPWPTVVT